MKNEMPLLDHLEELRKKFFTLTLIFLCLFSICAYFSKELFACLQAPLLPYLSGQSFFIATNLSVGWIVFLKTAFMVSLTLMLPILLLQIFIFTNPGLKKTEKKIIWPFSVAFLMFFYLGILFCYYWVLPYSYKFLIQIYSDSQIQFLPDISDYLSFTSTFLLSFGIMFDLPFVMLILIASHILSLSKLRAFRPYFYVLAFIIAAVLTPPDYISQTLMAIPLIALFELGALLGWIFKRRQKPV